MWPLTLTFKIWGKCLLLCIAFWFRLDSCLGLSDHKCLGMASEEDMALTLHELGIKLYNAMPETVQDIMGQFSFSVTANECRLFCLCIPYPYIDSPLYRMMC